MKYLIILLTFLVSWNSEAQDRLIDKAGKIRFFSEAPLEDIEATTNEALAALDMSSQQVAVSMWMKTFHFDKSLMEEHFNENYVESDKYPKATFTGTLMQSVDYSKKGTIEVPVEGKMTIHGVTNPVKSIVKLEISDKVIKAETVFVIAVADYKVKIPSIVIENIAEEVEVTANFSFSR